jgi:hypothetical protein
MLSGGWFFDYVIRNLPLTGTSAGKPLVVRFAEAVRRVGFVFGNGRPWTLLKLSAYTETGEYLGSVVHIGVEETRGPFLGLETSHPMGIAGVTVDYGGAPEAEQINELYYEPLIARPFAACVAQVAVGETATVVMGTLLQVQNLFAFSVRVTVRFLDQQGAPMPLLVDGTDRSTLEFELWNEQSRRFVLGAGEGRLRVGYACIESAYPVGGNVTLRTLNREGRLLHEAAVPASPGRTIQYFPVERDVARGLETGIALVNLSEVKQRPSFSLLQADGPPFTGSGSFFQLEPGEHRAFFLAERYESLPGSFRGGLMITCKGALAAAAIRTIDGLAASTIPMFSTEQ